MKLKARIKKKVKDLDLFLSERLKNFTLPGFKGKSIYGVFKFFVKGLFQEDMSLRASSLAFNFFLAIFPFIIFLFTLIAYIPVGDFRDEINIFIERFLPPSAFELLNETISDILKNQNAGLLSFGFLTALYFSSNGIASMMSSFDASIERKYQRNWFSIRFKSIMLTFLIVSILITTIAVSLTFTYGFGYLDENSEIRTGVIQFGLKTFEYLSTVLLVYLIYSSLYYFGSSKISQWKFFSVGSTLATILSLITTYAFAMYVENFNSYNKLYGSIGTILVVMLLIYFNSFVVLIGFEINRSIDQVE